MQCSDGSGRRMRYVVQPIVYIKSRNNRKTFMLGSFLFLISILANKGEGGTETSRSFLRSIRYFYTCLGEEKRILDFIVCVETNARCKHGLSSFFSNKTSVSNWMEGSFQRE